MSVAKNLGPIDRLITLGKCSNTHTLVHPYVRKGFIYPNHITTSETQLILTWVNFILNDWVSVLSAGLRRCPPLLLWGQLPIYLWRLSTCPGSLLWTTSTIIISCWIELKSISLCRYRTSYMFCFNKIFFVPGSKAAHVLFRHTHCSLYAPWWPLGSKAVSLTLLCVTLPGLHEETGDTPLSVF